MAYYFIFGLIVIIGIIVLSAVIINKTKCSNASSHIPLDDKQRDYSMKYCSNCGAEVLERAIVCVKCGCAVSSQYVETDTPSASLNALAFLFPIIGLILFLLYNDKLPRKAKGIGKWSLIGFIIGLLLSAIALI